MNILERDLNNIQDGIQVQLKNLKQKLDKLGSRILDTNNLVTAQVGPRSSRAIQRFVLLGFKIFQFKLSYILDFTIE